MADMDAYAGLPPVPLVEAGREGALALYRANPQAAHAQIDDAIARFGRRALAHADRRSQRWLQRAGNPLLPEIEAVAREVGRPGAWLLNLSYEWGCTTAVAADPAGGMRMLRTLDWPFHGIGRSLMAARHEGPAGRWLNLTWPGFAGVLTALCPGRFAVAFNQTPMRARRMGPLGLPMLLDWALNRYAWSRSKALPPAHLLRLVCDEAEDYAEARRRIVETPLCASCLVAVVGVEPGEGCAVERLEYDAHVREAPVAVANHWLSEDRGGRPRTRDSAARHATMEREMRAAEGLSWVRPPILNDFTRLAAELNPVTGEALAQAFEAEGAVTRRTPLAA